MALFKFRVVLCRIRLCLTLILRIKWLGSELLLKFCRFYRLGCRVRIPVITFFRFESFRATLSRFFDLNGFTLVKMIVKNDSISKKLKRAEMDSLPVSMVPLKKRAWKPNDNQIDLNIRNRLFMTHKSYLVQHKLCIISYDWDKSP